MKRIYEVAIAAAACVVSASAQDLAQDMQLKKMVEQDAAAQRTLVLLKDKLSDLREGAGMTLQGGIMKAVKNAPYSADQITESTQMLGDGTRIHSESKISMARDSQGRVRRETPDRITIWDPVENVTYTLDPKRQTVTQMKVMSLGSGKETVVRGFAFGTSGPVGVTAGSVNATYEQAVTISGSAAEAADHMKVMTMELNAGKDKAAIEAKIAQDKVMAPKRESLGLQRMEGLSAEGSRETSTIEAGAIGNDRALNIVDERWYSVELQTEMMSKHSDPRSGEQVTRLTNVHVNEPDPGLFQVPPGYQTMGNVPAPFMIRK